MTLQLDLSPELEERLRQEAERQQLAPDAVTLKLLNEHLPRPDKAAALLALFKQWEREDAANPEDENGEDLFAALDEDRTSNRKLFPPELKGITW